MTDVGSLPDALGLRHSPIVRSCFDHDDDIRITLRAPLEHQSNHLHDLWVNGAHYSSLNRSDVSVNIPIGPIKRV